MGFKYQPKLSVMHFSFLFSLLNLVLAIKKLVWQNSLAKWVVPEKIHTSPTDGILEILAGGGVKDSGNPGGRGVELKKSLLPFQWFTRFEHLVLR